MSPGSLCSALRASASYSPGAQVVFIVLCFKEVPEVADNFGFQPNCFGDIQTGEESDEAAGSCEEFLLSIFKFGSLDDWDDAIFSSRSLFEG